MADSNLRMTATVMQTLKPFLADPRARLSGAEIIRETKMFSGTLYPILMRLEGAGWLTSSWESVDPSEVGRPRRRLYKITALGQNLARAAIEEKGSRYGGLIWT